ncbi:MAG: hypothetical protein LWW78_05895 [Deltaproteobacteria bacterium]|nr:hypothetical protein [Deltaproteobacteria bacterium]
MFWRLGICILVFGFFLMACSKKEAINYNECLNCHKGIERIESHEFDCKDCHLKEKVPFLKTHDFIIRNPSDPIYVNIFCGRCHEEEIKNLKNSLHATMAGIINQTRYLWGAQPSASPPIYSANSALRPLPRPSPYPKAPKDLVDDFLRKKCLRCHIGTDGFPGHGLYRASGCAACHVIYNNEGRYLGSDMAIEKNRKGYPEYHNFTKNIPNLQCLHCHNSNHVGADYEGLFEHDYDEAYRSPIPTNIVYGMDYHHLARDVHAEAGLLCIDCHTKKDVMGDGKIYGYELSVPMIRCTDCHGGFLKKGPDKSLSNITYRSGNFYFSSKNGNIYNLKTFSRDIISHAISSHKRLRCSACHAQWSFGDYGLSVIREDAPSYKKWKRLRLQADPYLETFFKDPKKSLSLDILDKKMKMGIWFMGWRFRRWEFMPLGIENGKYAILRPKYQYFVSYVNKAGKVILDSKKTRWAFMPYVPHTISPFGRRCEACHLNPIAAGLGIFEEKSTDTKLFITVSPCLPKMRLLTKEEQKKLLTPTRRFQVMRFLSLTTN